MKHTRRQLLGVLAALVLGCGMLAAHGGMEHVMGTVAKVSDSAVTVTTKAGKSVEVMLDAKTTFTKGTKTVQKADLQTGDHVVIHASESGSTLTAHTVQIALSTPAKAKAAK